MKLHTMRASIEGASKHSGRSQTKFHARHQNILRRKNTRSGTTRTSPQAAATYQRCRSASSLQDLHLFFDTRRPGTGPNVEMTSPSRLVCGSRLDARRLDRPTRLCFCKELGNSPGHHKSPHERKTHWKNLRNKGQAHGTSTCQNTQ